MRGFIIILILTGCSAPRDYGPPTAFCAKDAELGGAVVAASARWSGASGYSVSAAEEQGCVPVRVSSTAPKDGGLASADRGILINPSVVSEAQRERVVLHEMGHELGVHEHHESAVGIMEYDGGPGCITEADLRLLCEDIACSSFEPEC